MHLLLMASVQPGEHWNQARQQQLLRQRQTTVVACRLIGMEGCLLALSPAADFRLCTRSGRAVWVVSLVI
jgi:hypothetical protein